MPVRSSVTLYVSVNTSVAPAAMLLLVVRVVAPLVFRPPAASPVYEPLLIVTSSSNSGVSVSVYWPVAPPVLLTVTVYTTS